MRFSSFRRASGRVFILKSQYSAFSGMIAAIPAFGRGRAFALFAYQKNAGAVAVRGIVGYILALSGLGCQGANNSYIGRVARYTAIIPR
jgi:hypothetical protein